MVKMPAARKASTNHTTEGKRGSGRERLRGEKRKEKKKRDTNKQPAKQSQHAKEQEALSSG